MIKLKTKEMRGKGKNKKIKYIMNTQRKIQDSTMKKRKEKKGISI